MSIADLIEGLAAKGASLDVILMAVRAVEDEQQKAAAKRAQAAERKRRQRDRERDSHATVTGQSEDTSHSAPSPNKSPPDPQKLTPTPVSVCGAPARKADPWRQIPEGVSEAAWSGLLANRRAKKSANSPHAYSLICGKLKDLAEAGYPPGEMVDLAVERGWTTVFEPKENRNGNRPPQSSGKDFIRDPVLADLARQAHSGMG